VRPTSKHTMEEKNRRASRAEEKLWHVGGTCFIIGDPYTVPSTKDGRGKRSNPSGLNGGNAIAGKTCEARENRKGGGGKNPSLAIKKNKCWLLMDAGGPASFFVKIEKYAWRKPKPRWRESAS